MEACRHEFSDQVFLSHKVVVEKHVNLVTPAPLYMVAHGLKSLPLIEVCRSEESSEDLPRNDELVDVVEDFGRVHSLRKDA